MSDPTSLALEVNAILDRYISVHDAVFKFSFRNLFKPMDFTHHCASLDALLPDLQRILSALSALPLPSSGFSSALHEYTSGLADTITQLRVICDQLALKTQDPSRYNASTYQQHVSSYENSVDTYRRLGERLNTLWNDSPTP